jgi:hypothetical protein
MTTHVMGHGRWRSERLQGSCCQHRQLAMARLEIPAVPQKSSLIKFSAGALMYFVIFGATESVRQCHGTNAMQSSSPSQPLQGGWLPGSQFSDCGCSIADSTAKHFSRVAVERDLHHGWIVGGKHQQGHQEKLCRYHGV